MSKHNQPAPEAFAKLSAYLEAKYAAELAAGWMLAAQGHDVALIRPGENGEAAEVRPVPLPPHLRPTLDAEAWHRAHWHAVTKGRNLATVGLPLFEEPEDPTAQGDLFG